MRPNDDYNVKIEAPSFNSRRISANIVIDGTIDDVWSILTDYNNLATHVPNLVQSYLVPGPPGSIRLFQEGNHGCNTSKYIYDSQSNIMLY